MLLTSLPLPRAEAALGSEQHLRSCPGLTRSGRAGSEAAAPSGPVRSIWPALLGTGCATVGGSGEGQRQGAGDAGTPATQLAGRVGLTFLPRI